MRKRNSEYEFDGLASYLPSFFGEYADVNSAIFNFFENKIKFK